MSKKKSSTKADKKTEKSGKKSKSVVSGLAANAADMVRRQSSWSVPAFATGLFTSNTKMLTWSVDVPQGPLSIVQTRMFSPTGKPEHVVVGSFTSAKVAEPCTTVHVPTATPTGVFAASVTLLAGVQIS